MTPVWLKTIQTCNSPSLSPQTEVKSAPGSLLCENPSHGKGIYSDLVVEWADNMSQGGNKKGDMGTYTREAAVITLSG